MAVGFNASGDYAKRTANLPAWATFTIAGWFKLRATPTAFAYFFGIENADADATKYAVLGYSTDGSPDAGWQFATSSGHSEFNPQPSTDVWYYFFIRSTTTTNAVESGFADVDDEAFQKSSAYATTVTPARLGIGNDSYDEWVNCAAAYVRVWDAELTDAELLAERNSATPVITATLRADWPLANNTDTGDDSGNGYDLTFGGTLTSEDGPLATPVSFSVASLLIGNPVLVTPILFQTQNLTANALSFENPILGTPKLVGADEFEPLSIINTPPIFGNPSLFQIQHFISNNLLTGNVVLENPILNKPSTDHLLVANLLQTGVPVLGNPSQFPVVTDAFTMAESVYFLSGSTSAQLIPPSGKTTGSFTVGRIEDNYNPTFAIDIASGSYTEVEFCIWVASDTDPGDYDFRIADLDSYSVTPTLTVESSFSFTASGLTTGNPVLGTPQFNSTAKLSSLSLATGNSQLGNPALTQKQNLVANGLISGIPINGCPSVESYTYQYFRPDATTYQGDWTTQAGGTDLSSVVDEISADDSDYIQSAVSPSNSICVLRLETLGDPLVSGGHTLRYRYGKDVATENLNLTVQLCQDYVNESGSGTLIAQWVHSNISTEIAQADQNLTSEQTDSITNYGSLFVRMIASVV